MYSHSVFSNYCSICHIIASEEMLIRFEIALNFKLTRPAAAMCCCIFEYSVRIEILTIYFLATTICLNRSHAEYYAGYNKRRTAWSLGSSEGIFANYMMQNMPETGVDVL